ncbi:MAG: selenoneine biosynthesis selenosugar synthase SenB [bacterium]|nr:selenoneine biosynthesis selenosugar synthase SenB [bacterium]
MKICLVTPAPARSRKGNRVTALRWARILRELGHRVTVEQTYENQRCDLLVALHARRSHASLVRFRLKHPDLPLILALTGTDLYGDIHTDPSAQESLELASRLILLQPMGADALPKHLRGKARVIYQSVRKPPGTFVPKKSVFEVCVLGHLRPVKDPFRAAQAARLLPPASKIRVVQVGAALSEEMERKARAEEASNPRYRWLGELPRWKALRVLARSRLLALSSKMEGGANVVSEALACSVPIVSSRISGSIGILGADYPGYFPTGDTQALANLLERAEGDADFYETLKAWCNGLRHLVEPANERKSWESLLEEICGGGRVPV